MKTTKMEADPTAQPIATTPATTSGAPPAAQKKPVYDPEAFAAAAKAFQILVWDADAFAKIVLLLRKHFLFSVTSWGRTPARNAMVKGLPNSHHLTFEAVDCVLDDVIHDTVHFVEASHVAGLHVDCSDKDHVHIQTP